MLVSLVGGPAGAADPLDPVLGDPGVTLPNLVPDVRDPFIVRPPVFDEPTRTFVDGPPQLWFEIRAQNVGTVPLQITVDDRTKLEASSVSQCVSWRADHVCRQQRPVDGFRWVPQQTRVDFPGFASTELRHLSRRGGVDYSRRGLIARTDKTSFCLADSVAVRDDANPVPFYVKCEATEGISAGWARIYSQEQEGQRFWLDGLTDGRYALVLHMDSADHVYETDDADNVVEVIVEISGGMTQAAIVGRNYP